MALSIRFNFVKRAFALPFFTVLEPSEKSTKKQGKRHKTTLDWSVQMVMQLVRWAPSIPFILVGDGGFASANARPGSMILQSFLQSREYRFR